MSLIVDLKTLYSRSLFLQNSVKKLAFQPPYFPLTRQKVIRQSKSDLTGPFNLQIEVSNFCNARCLMCPYTTMKRKRRFMTDKSFNRILARIDREKLPLNKVFLSGMGEPLLHPKVLQYLKELKKRRLHVRLYTNASLLTTKISQKLVILGLDEINISFNGASPTVYQKVMGLDQSKTLKNIENLLAIRRQSGRKLPRIQVSLIVIDENEKEVTRHLKAWREKVDSVTVSRAHSWGGGTSRHLALRTSHFALVYPCRSLWHTYAIDSAGSYILCCRDYESKHILGHVSKDTFAQAFRSPVIQGFRQKHLQYKEGSLPPMCRQCNFPYQLGVEWWLGRGSD